MLLLHKSAEPAHAAPFRTGAVHLSWLWFWLGCLGAAWQIFAMLRGGFGRGWEMLNVARALAEGHGFRDPFQVLPTGPTAMEPPAFPVFLSVLIRLFGDGDGLALSSTLVSILGHGLYAALLPSAAERLTGNRTAGHAAALLAVVLPAFPLMPQWDAILTSAGLLLYLAAAQPGFGWRAGAGLGAFAGFLSLWNPMTSLAAFLRVLFLAPRRRAAIALLAAWTAGYFAVAGVWMARNRAVLGTWSPRTNLGTTLYVSNNDCAAPHLLATIASGCYNRNHPNKSPEEAALIVALGEREYDRVRVEASLHWMRQHPGRTLELSAARLAQFWFPQAAQQSPYAQAVWIVTLLSIAGMILMARDGARAWIYLLAVSWLVPLPYYFVVADIRYRTPILWAAHIAAGYLLARLWPRLRRARSAT
jgi:hypothetical protein